MERIEREFVDSWIEENVKLITNQSTHLLTYLKNTSSDYGEVVNKLDTLKKSVIYRCDSKLLLPIVESAIDAIEVEKNTLLIKRADI